MEEKKLLNIAVTSATTLANLVNEQGKFCYAFNVKKIETLGGYNMVRHAGCLWSLYRTANALASMGIKMDSRYFAQCEKALKYLYSKIGRAFPGDGSPIVDKGWANLGATGLAVLALCEASLSAVPTIPELHNHSVTRLIRELCAYIMLVQGNTGEFTMHKVQISDGEVSNFVSNFYPGEALLGLSKARQVLADPIFDQNIEAGIRYYYTDCKSNGFHKDHWMIQALALYNSKYIDYADAIVRATLKTKIPYHDTCSIACRTEALLAYGKILKTTAPIPNKLIADITKLIIIQQGAYISDGLFKGAWVAKPGSSIARCDYIQHNLAAIIGYLELTGGGEKLKK